MKTIALLGAGALANVFAKALTVHLSDEYTIIGATARHIEHAQALSDTLPMCRAVNSVAGLIALRPDMIVEFAGRPAIQAHAEEILAAGIDLVAVSIGAFADRDLLDRCAEAARTNNCRLYLPNGAIGALDLLQTFSLMGIDSLRIENAKHPRSLEGAPYLLTHPMSATEPQKVFEGSVTDAINGFPKNVNVAVAASLAADFPNATVTVESDPTLTQNSHHIIVENSHARAELTVVSNPDPVNPKSSVSTAWSVVALLKNLAGPVTFF